MIEKYGTVTISPEGIVEIRDFTFDMNGVTPEPYPSYLDLSAVIALRWAIEILNKKLEISQNSGVALDMS